MVLDETKLQIRPALLSEWDTAMALAWRTFRKHVAHEYTPEGIRNFEDFVTDQVLKRMFVIGQYRLFCAFYDKDMIGMISLRDCTHISLLFVEGKFHGMGVGARLIQYVKRCLEEELGEGGMTVDAAPNAEEFYHKMGFVDMRPRETKSGIIYTPMFKLF